MIEQVFSHFLHKQKSAWLERKSKGKEPTSDLVSESEIRYEKNTWLAKAVKQARYAITTHASTFTHPDAKTSCFLFETPVLTAWTAFGKVRGLRALCLGAINFRGEGE